MESYRYDPESLKVKIEPKQTKTVESRLDYESLQEEEAMSNKKAVLIIFMLIIMYAVLSALPTYILMHFAHLSFWLSQVIFIVVGCVATFLLGWHKPASNEQKLKSKFLL